ncbi:hypothetical protein D3C86_2069980 [compost metagenome]
MVGLIFLAAITLITSALSCFEIATVLIPVGNAAEINMGAAAKRIADAKAALLCRPRLVFFLFFL